MSHNIRAAIPIPNLGIAMGVKASEFAIAPHTTHPILPPPQSRIINAIRAEFDCRLGNNLLKRY
ncbi:hypothetical protein H6G27_33360 [Nostoc linckia FACHB-104]|nr:hypothetical protein [Nostoc linckia FACHB-104]